MLCKEPGVLPGSDFYFGPALEGDKSLHQEMVMCGHYHCVRGYEVKRQFYQYLLIAYIVGGTFFLEYEGGSHTARQGDVVFIDCQKPHHFGAGDHMEFAWVHFDSEIVRNICREVLGEAGPVLNHPDCEAVYQLIRGILAAHRNGQALSAYRVSAAIYEMACLLYPARAESDLVPPGQAIDHAIEYMKYHLSGPVSLADIAAAAHMSKYYFSRVFRRHTGYSPYDYLIKLRLDMAKYLLATTDQSIMAIALSVGYESEMGFVNSFTEKVGMSPGRYRNNPL